MQQPASHQLPPTTAIKPDTGLRATAEKWFEYPVRAQPHHTDYAGAVWHGTYLTWMEEARVECLRSIGIDFSSLIALGCDLPVVEASLRYHRPLRLGETAVVRTRMSEVKGVRIPWEYQIQSPEGRELYLTGLMTLVAVDREKGKILRQLPPSIQDVLEKLSS